MRPTTQVLALALALGLHACTAEPMPSSATPSMIVAATNEHTMTSTDATRTEHLRIPLLDQEAPKKFETATFALG